MLVALPCALPSPPGTALNAHLHFHCVVIDGVFDVTATGGVVFHAAIGLEANAIAQVQAQVRRRLLRGFVRRGRLPADDAQAMGQRQHGSGFPVDGSVRIEAADRAGRERPLTGRFRGDYHRLDLAYCVEKLDMQRLDEKSTAQNGPGSTIVTRLRVRRPRKMPHQVLLGSFSTA